jgi:putative inorganic carbon (hco3(-)) transporter
MLYAIVLTGSRGAIVGLGAAMLVAFRSRFGNGKTMMLVGVFAPLALIALTQVGGREMSSKEKSA